MMRVTRAVLPELLRSRNAAIVIVSSVLATTGVRRRTCYAASKGVVLSLGLAMTADLIEDACESTGSRQLPPTRLR